MEAIEQGIGCINSKSRIDGYRTGVKELREILKNLPESKQTKYFRTQIDAVEMSLGNALKKIDVEALPDIPQA